jgi:uncharacterized membrane-anchored protein
MKSVTELLSWVIYSGGAILAASWILERIRGFQAQTPENKRLIAMAVSVAIAVAAYAVLTYVPAQILVQLDPWLTVTLGTIILYSGGQIYHQATKDILPPFGR